MEQWVTEPLMNHDLEWTSAECPFYGAIGVITDVRRCKKCGMSWPYGTPEAEIRAFPCMDDPKSVRTLQEINKIKYEMKTLETRILWIQEACPHKYVMDGFEMDMDGNILSECCLVCGLWREKRETWAWSISQRKRLMKI